MNGFDGKEHELLAILTVGLMALAGIGVYLLFPSFPYMPELYMGLVFGAVWGFFLTPDIDHEWLTREEYRAKRWFGGLGSLWVVLWKPYAKLFGHRSKWTHSIVGTLIRCIPFIFITGLAFDLVLSEMGLAFYTIVFHIAMVTGWAIQDMVHYRHDGLGWLGVRE